MSYLRMQLLAGEPTDKKQKLGLLKRRTTICPLSLLAFSDFDRAVGTSPPRSWIHRVINFFYELQVFLMLQMKLNNVPLTYIIPVMHCYAPWKHQKTFMSSDVLRGHGGATLGWNGLVNLYYYCNEYGSYWANYSWFSGFAISS